MLQNMFNKNMLVVPSTISTSLRKCQPTLLAQVVSCRDVSVKQEQGINVEASRLCVTSGQSTVVGRGSIGNNCFSMVKNDQKSKSEKKN